MDNGREWTEWTMDRNGPKWTKMDLSGRKWTLICKHYPFSPFKSTQVHFGPLRSIQVHCPFRPFSSIVHSAN